MEEGLDRQPRSESIRLLSAVAYLPPVAPFLLLSKRHRGVRLVRFHAVQSLGVGTLVVAGILLGNALSAVFVSWPSVGFWSNLLVGFGLVALLLMATSLAVIGAWAAYRGTYTRIPLLTDWTWRMLGAPSVDRGATRRRRRRDREVLDAVSEDALTDP
jgi:uncharacterized membrane protein